ncbi:unnamed protein product, partial [Ectocarpus sp. 12 AP-2014]
PWRGWGGGGDEDHLSNEQWSGLLWPPQVLVRNAFSDYANPPRLFLVRTPANGPGMTVVRRQKIQKRTRTQQGVAPVERDKVHNYVARLAHFYVLRVFIG